MSVVTQPLTYDDLCRQREDGNRYELIEGELILVAAPPPAHQRASRILLRAFDSFITSHGLGEVFSSPLDVRLAPPNVVQPDLVVILRENAQIITDALIEGVPDLVVEIISPSSRAIDQGRKRVLYARAGVCEFWLVDFIAKSITIHTEPAADGYRQINQVVDVARSTVLPGFAISLSDLFASN